MTDSMGFNLEDMGKTLKALSDAASQTDGTSVALHYPANLLYAQNMLAISMSALQRLELNMAQIHLYLREHELRAAAATAASAKLAISAAGFGVAKVTIINPASVGAGAGAQAAGMAAGGQEPREVVVVGSPSVGSSRCRSRCTSCAGHAQATTGCRCEDRCCDVLLL
jgi:hypothetical protein